MFNSITKKLKGDPPPVKKSDELEGFICPVCMSSFTSPEMVQQHFDEKHPDGNSNDHPADTLFSPTTQRKESIRDIQENFNDLRQSLDEELWYNEELKKECTRLNSVNSERQKDIESRDKVIEDYSKQIAQMESARDTLNEELKKMQISKTSLIAENKTIRADFRVCEEKMIELERSRDELMEITVRQKHDCDQLTEDIAKLQVVTNVDDEGQVALLTERMVEISLHLQGKEKEVMDLLVEVEKMKSDHLIGCQEWERKYTELSTENAHLQNDKLVMVQTHEKTSSDYQQQLHSTALECEELRKKSDCLNENLIKMKRNWDSDKSQLDDINIRLKDALTEVQSSKSQNRDMIKNHDVETLQIKNACANKDEEIKFLQKCIKGSSEELASVKLQLDAERSARDDLQSKVEMTDAANIVMEQLQLEKKTLQETVNSVRQQLDQEIDRANSELSMLRMEMQSQKEEILNLTSLVSEKELKIKESEKASSDVQIVCEKFQQKANEEMLGRLSLEDQIVALTSQIQALQESLSTSMESHVGLKKEHELYVKQCQEERDAAAADLTRWDQEIGLLKSEASKVPMLEKEIEEARENMRHVDESLKVMTTERNDLARDLDLLRNDKVKLEGKLLCAEDNSRALTVSINENNREIEKHLNVIKSKDIAISELQVQIIEQTKATGLLNNELSIARQSETELRQEVDIKREESIHNKKSIETLETELSQGLITQSSLESEIRILKENLREKVDSISLLTTDKEQAESICLQNEEVIEKLRKTLDSICLQKEDLETELRMARTQIEETQRLYSESMRIQNLNANELQSTSEALDKVNKQLCHTKEQFQTLENESSMEIEKLRKDGIQWKNHAQAIEKTLNESSETYKQESLEFNERAMNLTSQCEELESNMVKLTKSLQRTEEDLETEKGLRQTERNNMMEKISQLTLQVTEDDKTRNDLEHRLDSVETDNIELKIRFEAEKEKLLDNIIRLENNLKKQNETVTKKSREFDQLQSAILDLGRENQSLQITKEKITSRLWIVDDEAIECHSCHKMFSLTNRKHHCRNCGQVFCQDCSTKTATLAVSRKPVRVCDGCHMEVHSHRRNSSTQSSNISLSLQH